jgi:hypothetical protein
VNLRRSGCGRNVQTATNLCCTVCSVTMSKVGVMFAVAVVGIAAWDFNAVHVCRCLWCLRVVMVAGMG